MTLKEFQNEIEKLHYWATEGCSNGNCKVKRKTGMHTNGICHCTPHRFAERLLELACKLEEHKKHRGWIDH